jgi:hypothetical protein
MLTMERIVKACQRIVALVYFISVVVTLIWMENNNEE